MKEVVYIVLENYADHELPYMAQGVTTDEVGPRKEPKYVNKIAAPTMEPVKSVGGFRIVPDYSFASMPKDYAALVLIGGYGWQSDVADSLAPIVKDAIDRKIVVGAICNAASWMAKQGFLNNVKHTGNGLAQLKLWGGKFYTNEGGYVNKQAVSDGNIVTANGTGHLEFACELLKLLQNDTPEMIGRYEYFYKQGLVAISSPRPRFTFNTIGLFTTDNTKMVAFYRDVFGFSTDWNGQDPNVEMKLGNSRIIMFPRSGIEQMTSQKFTYPQGTNGTMEISFDVPTFADVDKEYNGAVAKGAEGIFPPTTEPWGQRTSYVSDPEGNLIEISSFVKA